MDSIAWIGRESEPFEMWISIVNICRIVLSLPLRKAEADSKKRSDNECPGRFETKRAEKKVFTKKRGVKAVLPAIHFHDSDQLTVEYSTSLSDVLLLFSLDSLVTVT